LHPRRLDRRPADRPPGRRPSLHRTPAARPRPHRRARASVVAHRARVNDHSGLVVRAYLPTDEREWLGCRLLAFFHTAYFDDVKRSKTSLPDGSIELVAVDDHRQIVGIIDIEIESPAA